LAGTTVLVMSAAVSDFRPAECHPNKVKKADGEAAIALQRTTDILKGLVGRTPKGLIKVGFAAETEQVLAYARDKRADKDLDLIVANDVTAPDAGFAGDTNRVTLIGRDGAEEALDLLPKAVVASRILDRVLAQRAVSEG